jgi:hypothetical protein
MSKARTPSHPAAQWDVPLKRPKSPAWPYLQLKPGKSANVWIYSRRVEITQVHPFEGYTLGCTGEPGLCWASHQHTATLVQGSLLGRIKETSARVLVLLTPWALWHCPSLLDRKKDLRGSLLTLFREEGERTAKMTARLTEAPANVAATLKAPSTQAMMCRIWAGGARRIREKGQGTEALAIAEAYWLEQGQADEPKA